MDIKSILARSKQKKFLGEGDTAIRSFIDAKIKESIEATLSEIVPKLYAEAKEILDKQLDNLTKNVRKGDKGEDGYTPIAGVDYQIPKDGQDGKDYILTKEDKQKIASLIEVPIVEKIIEKTEVLKPEIKEVAKYETPEQICDKINTLEERLEISTVKGLKGLIENLKKSIRELGGRGGSGGGGMGNPVHTSTALTASTTFVDLSTSVAANGRAVWVYYQGQWLVYGTHYTVSGSRITLLITPVDGTYLDTLHIRT